MNVTQQLFLVEHPHQEFRTVEYNYSMYILISSEDRDYAVLSKKTCTMDEIAEVVEIHDNSRNEKRTTENMSFSIQIFEDVSLCM